jgi:hypothetical protein
LINPFILEEGRDKESPIVSQRKASQLPKLYEQKGGEN